MTERKMFILLALIAIAACALGVQLALSHDKKSRDQTVLFAVFLPLISWALGVLTSLPSDEPLVNVLVGSVVAFFVYW